MSDNRHSDHSQHLDLQRLLFLTDGVFAITLLVLDLKPSVGSRANLGQAFIKLLPSLGAYFFAFVTIANQWLFHHRAFRLVLHADGRLALLSFCYLLFITLIPVSAAILGDALANPFAVAFFSINLLLVSLSAWGVWSYIAKTPELLSDEADPGVFRRVARFRRAA